ncbi:hypothetical protein AB6E91_08520 [Staphylococcus saprophyticus]|uniref:hypothetical protein n=1 Tax=Staphylococcus saprophyticus TaxID=29385 RepID=UPI0034DD0AB3
MIDFKNAINSALFKEKFVYIHTANKSYKVTDVIDSGDGLLCIRTNKGETDVVIDKIQSVDYNDSPNMTILKPNK